MGGESKFSTWPPLTLKAGRGLFLLLAGSGSSSFPVGLHWYHPGWEGHKHLMTTPTWPLLIPWGESGILTTGGWWKTCLCTRSPLTSLQHGGEDHLITAKWWWKSRRPQWSPLTLWGMGSLLLIKDGFLLSLLWHEPGKGRNLGSPLGIFWYKWGWDHSCFVVFHWSRVVFV